MSGCEYHHHSEKKKNSRLCSYFFKRYTTEVYIHLYSLLLRRSQRWSCKCSHRQNQERFSVKLAEAGMTSVEVMRKRWCFVMADVRSACALVRGVRKIHVCAFWQKCCCKTSRNSGFGTHWLPCATSARVCALAQYPAPFCCWAAAKWRELSHC